MKIIRSVLKRLTGRFKPKPSQEDADELIVQKLRATGVKIGRNCRIYSNDFSTDPFLVTIGDNVLIAGGVKMLTHNGAARLLKARRPLIQSFGKIEIESDCFIGENVIVLPGTHIGRGSIIGAGAVVRGSVPENALVIGNPGQVVGRASLFLERLNTSPDTLDTFGLDENSRREKILVHFY